MRREHAERYQVILCQAPEDATLLDVISDPVQLAGRNLRVSARWVEAAGWYVHLDDVAAVSVDGIMMVELAPPGRASPSAMFALDGTAYRDRVTFFEQLNGAEVEVVVYMPPAEYAEVIRASGADLPCIGRILEVRPR